MRIEELSGFLELVRQRNVTRAAAELRMTQPALSRSLARLESEIGVDLFERHGRRLRLNRYGEILAPHAARIVAELDDARTRIEALKAPDAGVVSIAYVTSFGTWLVPAVAGSYQRLFPDVTFLLSGGPADDVLDAVRNGSADVGFLSPEPTGSDLSWTELTEEPLVLVVASSHSFADRTDITARDLNALEIAALKPEFGLRQITDAYLAKIDASPKIVMEVTELSTLRSFAESGVAAAIIPAVSGNTRASGYVQIPLEKPLKRPVGMIVPAARRAIPAAAQFARFVVEEHRCATVGRTEEAGG